MLVARREVLTPRQVKTELESFSNLNKKALDQFRRLRSDRDRFQAKLDEAQSSHTAIERLIEKLDRDKDEKIQDFLKRVDLKFREVMPLIVRGCKASLVAKMREGKKRVEPCFCGRADGLCRSGLGCL